MTFKEKQRKTQRVAQNATVDKSHREHINKFEKLEKYDKFNYQNRLVTSRKELARFESIKSKGGSITDRETTHMSYLRDQIRDFERQIKRIDKGQDELQYFEQNGDNLIAYYQLSQDQMAGHWGKKHNESEDELDRLNNSNQNSKNKRPPTVRKIKAFKSTSGDICSFLNSCKTKVKKTVELDPTIKGTISGNQITLNKSELADAFFTQTDPNYRSKKARLIAHKYCKSCGEKGDEIEMVLVFTMSMYYCRECGETEHVVMDSEKPSYKEPMGDQTMSPYKRINHQLRWLKVIATLMF
jgi:ribosomal protein L33